MSQADWWIVVSWGAAPLLFGVLLTMDWLRGRQRALEGGPEPARPAMLFGGRIAPQHGIDRLTPHQQLAMQRPPQWPDHRQATYAADVAAAAAPHLIELVALPFRLVWWSWAARTWRPLALLWAYGLALVSPLAWLLSVMEVGGQPRDVGLTTAYPALAQVPLLLLIGLWPWQERRGIGYAVAAGVILGAWVWTLRSVGR